MIFTLEALQAEKGDSLILHYGNASKPRFVVIDGGPNPVFEQTLQPRLDQLRAKWGGANDRLPLEMVMVSHIDDDHINGILAWLRMLREKRDIGEALPDSIRTLWFNSFDEVLGDEAEELRSVLAAHAEHARRGGTEAAAFHPDAERAAHSAAVVASVGQGRELRAIAKQLAIPLNLPFQGLVMPSEEAGDRVVSLDGGLKLHVLGPTRPQVKALQEEWAKEVKKKPLAAAAAFADRSVANLSSIVAVAEFSEEGVAKRMLLTGDARGDFIWDGLIHAGFLRDREDHIHFDIIKMPHHGSNRNMTQAWLEHVTAHHYVISANGEHDNPDADTVGWISAARSADSYTIHITNERLVNPKKTGAAADISGQVNAVLNASASTATHRTVSYRKNNALSLKVDLGSTAVSY